MALKQGSQETLNDRFQYFWAKRCGNGFHLSNEATYNVLCSYASKILKPHEALLLHESIGRELCWSKDKAISLEKMNDLYLCAIHNIKMMFDDGKDN